MNHTHTCRTWIVYLIASISAIAASGGDAVFVGLNPLMGHAACPARGESANGRVVVGASWGATGGSQACRSWSSGTTSPRDLRSRANTPRSRRSVARSSTEMRPLDHSPTPPYSVFVNRERLVR